MNYKRIWNDSKIYYKCRYNLGHEYSSLVNNKTDWNKILEKNAVDNWINLANLHNGSFTTSCISI